MITVTVGGNIRGFTVICYISMSDETNIKLVQAVEEHTLYYD